eukprot:gene10726-3346_t
MYLDDFKEFSDKPHPHFQIRFGVYLIDVHLNEKYPLKVPEIKIYQDEIENENLTSVIMNMTKNHLGEVMIFDLIQELNEFINQDIKEEFQFQKEEKISSTVLYKYVTNEKQVIDGENFLEYSNLHHWKEGIKSELLSKRSFHSSDSFGNQIYFFGGIFEGKYSNDFLVLERDIVTQLKSVETPSSRILSTLNSISLNQSMNLFLIGGMDKKMNYLNEIYCFDQKYSKWKLVNLEGDEIPYLAGHSTTISSRKSFIIFGGFGKQFKNSNLDFSNNFYELHVKFSHLTKLTISSPPKKRSGHSSGMVNGNVFIFGGHNQNEIFDDLFMLKYDNHWICTEIRTKGPRPALTHSSDIFQINSNSFLITGGHDSEKKNSKYVYKFDIEKNQWFLMINQTNESDEVGFASSTKMNDSIYIIGGIKDNIKIEEDYKKIILKTFTSLHKVNFDHYSEKLKILEKYQDHFLNSGLFEHSTIVDKIQKEMKNWFNKQIEGDTIILFDDGSKILCHRWILKKNLIFKKVINSSENENKIIEIFISNYVKTPNFKFIFLIIEYLYTSCFDLSSQELKKEGAIEVLLQNAIDLKCHFIEEICKGKLTFNSITSNHLNLNSKELINQTIKMYSLDKIESIPRLSGIVNLIAPINEEENGFVQAHKGYLSETSEYFKTMFTSSFSESESDDIEIFDISLLTLTKIIQYLYTGILPIVTADICIEMYLSIHKFEFHELIPYLRSIIKDRIEDNDTACALLDISYAINDKYMYNFCLQFLTKNYESIQNLECFKHLDQFFKSEILNSFVRRNT